MAESGLWHSRSTPQTWTCLWGPGLKARAPSGAAGSNPRSLRHDVHVRQIRLAAAVRKTATLRGDGGSNPLACTRLVFVASGATERSISQPSYCEKSIVRIVCRTATSSNDRTPPCRGVRCEFDSRRSRQFRRCTLGWFGECSFKAPILEELPRGFCPATGATLRFVLKLPKE